MDSPAFWIALPALVLATVALVFGWVQQQRYAVLQRRFRVLWGDGAADVSTVLARQAQRVDVERERVDALGQQLSALRGDLTQTLQHVAVVRYDAFGDMGGRMSFSAAIIDGQGDGMILSSIHARGESRTYAKGIVGGRSDVTLSPEERRALDAARSGRSD